MKKQAKKIEYRDLLARYNIYLVVACFFIILFIKIILSAGMYCPFIMNDEFIYDDIAKNILDGRLYSTQADYPPGYPALLSIAYVLTNEKVFTYHIMLTISALISTLIIFPAYFLLKRYVNDKNAILCSLAITLFPGLNFYCFTLMSENLFSLLFIISIFTLMKSYESDSRSWQILAAGTLVYLYMTRSLGLLMIAGFVIAFIIDALINRSNISIMSYIKNKLVLLVSLAFFFTSWIIVSTFSADLGNGNLPLSLGLITGLLIIITAFYFGAEKSDRLSITIKNRRMIIAAVAAVAGIAALSLIVVSGSGVFDNFVGGSSERIYSGGTAYDVINIPMKVVSLFSDINNVIDGIEILSNHLSYIVIASFFIAPVILTYYISGGSRRMCSSIRFVEKYVYVSLFMTILGSVVFTLYFNLFANENHVSLGRYVEPFIPALIVLAALYVNHDGKKWLDTHTKLFIGAMITSLILVLLTTIYAKNIFVTFAIPDIANNPSIEWLKGFSGSGTAWMALVIFAGAFAAICYSSFNKKNLARLFGAMIICSVLITLSLYSYGIDNSTFRKDNDINKFLQGNSDKNTRLLLDMNMSSLEMRASCTIYSFWNSGVTEKMVIGGNIKNQQDTYIISIGQLPYNIVSNDQRFKLYKVC